MIIHSVFLQYKEKTEIQRNLSQVSDNLNLLTISL